jgi:hypothetical protein
VSERQLTPILIITPYFAPQTHAAMFRVHKLVKYLPEHGYKPIVLTTDINYLYNENSELLNELPDCVEIIRTRHVEPSMRGLRMALGGRDRTFKATKSIANNLNVTSVGPIAVKRNPVKSFLSSLYSMITQFLYNIPDAHWTWALSSRKTAEKLIKQYDIKLMYTTANPYSHLGLASRLKEKFDLKWLADFRDPCGYGYKNGVNSYIGLKLQRHLLSDTFARADKISGLAETYSAIFSDLYGLDDSKYSFIPTGVDDAYLPEPGQITNEYSNQIIFAGEVMPEQNDYIFEVIQELAVTQSIGFTFIGREEVNRPIVEALIARLPNWNVPVNFIDHLPQQVLYQTLRSAKACILAPGSNRYWWTNFAKMVDYIALAIPVIADVPILSEARKELTRAGLGFFLEHESIEQDASRLQSWFENIESSDTENDYRKRYLASSQVAAFAALFDELNGMEKA